MSRFYVKKTIFIYKSLKYQYNLTNEQGISIG